MGVLELTHTPDAGAAYNRHKEAADGIEAYMLSSLANVPKLTDIMPTLDKEQADKVEKILKQRVIAPDNDTHDPISDVRIGLVWTSIPPDKIRVHEVRHSDDIAGLRTSSNSLAKTGRGKIRIDMEMEFTVGGDITRNSINDELRVIIAQFKASPFVPLESHYIANAVFAQSAKVDTGAVDKAALELERAYKEYTDLQDAMANLMINNTVVLDRYANINNLDREAAATHFRRMQPPQLDEAATIAISVPEAIVFEESEMAVYRQVHRKALDAKKIIDKIRDMHAQLVEIGVPESSKRPVVPAILHTMDISTVPGQLHSLNVRLSMIYFSHEAFIPDMMYKDALGAPTLELRDCPFYTSYLQRRFLTGSTEFANLEDEMAQGHRTLGKYEVDDGSRIHFEYPIPKFVEVNEDDADQAADPTGHISADKVGGRALNIVGHDATGKKYKNLTAKLDVGNLDTEIVPAQIIVSLVNRIGLQPTQGSHYGTAQYLGAMNAKAKVLFHVTGQTAELHNEAAARIHSMVYQSEQVAQVFGPRMRRNHKIAVINNVLNLVGIRHIQLDGMKTRTVPGEVYSSVVTLAMTEYTVSQETREALHLALPDKQTSMLEQALRELTKAADMYLKGEGETPRGSLASNSDLGSYCRALLYGTGTQEGLVSRIVVEDYLRNDPIVMSTVQNYVSNPRRYTPPQEPLSAQDEAMYRKQWEWEAARRGMPASNPSRKQLEWMAARNRQTSRKEPTNTWARKQDELKRLAKETLEFWRSSKVKVPGLAQTKDFKKDSRGIITMESGPITMNSLLMRTLSKPEFIEEFGKLKAAADWAVQNLPSMRKYVKSRLEDARIRSNYPDMDLPTYAELFLGLSDVFIPSDIAQQEADNAMQAARLNQDTTLAGLGNKTKAILRRFMPTYRDLGKRPPIKKDAYDIAKSFYDVVDPDFFYFHFRMSDFFDSVADQVQSEVDAIHEPESNAYKNSKGNMLESRRRMTTAKSMQRLRYSIPDSVYWGLQDDERDASNVALIEDPDSAYPRLRFQNGAWELTEPIAGLGRGKEFAYAPALPDMQETIGKFVHDDPAHLKKLFRETQEARKDQVNRMLRAFPTFKLYFIELDNEEWGYWDDFYGYNAVAGIRLSEHKFEPDLLEIKIINTTGNLDEEHFRMSEPDKSADVEYDERKELGGQEEVTDEPQWIDRFWLQIGTNIQLKMGYGASESDLSTKFTGQVVEIRPGDIITIICQSYKNELTVPLSTHKKGSDSDPLDVIRYVMENSPTIHFGEWSPYETGLLPGVARDGSEIDLESTERLGWLGYRQGPEGRNESDEQSRDKFRLNKNIGFHELGGLINKLASYTTTRKLSNVYLPRANWGYEAMSWWRGREFVIPDRTGLEVLHELTRHLPGYVFDVREYDHRATLFFGKPEQRYFYTSTKQDESRLWQQFKTETGQRARAAFKKVIKSFESSDEGRAAIAAINGARGESYKASSAMVKVAGQLPGRFLGLLSLGLAGKSGSALYTRVAQNYLQGSEQSPDAITALNGIEAKLGRVNLQLLTGYFFNRWNNKGNIYESSTDAALDIFSGNFANALRHGARAYDYWAFPGAHSESLERFDARFVDGVRNSPGTIFISLLDWRSKVEAISTKNDGKVAWTRHLQSNVFHLAIEETKLNVSNTNAGVTTSEGSQIPAGPYAYAVDSIIAYIPDWKIYLEGFHTWLQAQTARFNDLILKEAYTEAQKADRYDHDPRTKRFRNHHYVNDSQHIVKNSIIATKEQMANTVVVKYPGDIGSAKAGDRIFIPSDLSWKTWELMVDENITPSEKKVRLITEVNVEDTIKAELVAYSNLAEALRPMYRGQLILHGDDLMEPYDIIWISDHYENMHGPIEVERVLTHFTAQDGYLTIIVPQLLAIPKSDSSIIDAKVCGAAAGVGALARVTAVGAVGFGVGALAGTVVGGPVGTVGGGIVGAAAGTTGMTVKESMELEEGTGAGIWGNLMGRGRYGNMKVPVDLMPLMKNGIPWTAGLKGFGEGNWMLRMMKRWENIKRGWKFAKKAVEKIIWH